MNWADVVKTIVTNTVFLTVIGFVAKSIFERMLSRDMDKFKAELQARYEKELERFRVDLKLTAFEHETRFAKLHERRAEVIAALHKMLVQVQRTFPMTMPTSLSREDREEALNSLSEFARYFDENRIYLSSHLCDKLEALHKEFSNVVTFYSVDDMSPQKFSANSLQWH